MDAMKGAVAAASLALLLAAGCGTQEGGNVVGEGPVSGTAGTKSGEKLGTSTDAGSGVGGQVPTGPDAIGSRGASASGGATTTGSAAAGTEAPGSGGAQSSGTSSAGSATGSSGGTSPSPR